MFRFSPLAPGIWLMRRLRLPTKLGVLSSVLVVPLLVICVLLVQRLGEDIRLAENEADGVRVISLMRCSSPTSPQQISSGDHAPSASSCCQ